METAFREPPAPSPSAPRARSSGASDRYNMSMRNPGRLATTKSHKVSKVLYFFHVAISRNESAPSRKYKRSSASLNSRRKRRTVSTE